jgi:1,2-dihydroxy-3-keto-5-methylthiopentene dioxygenase
MKAGEEVDCSDDELRAEGIRCETFDTAAATAVMRRLQAERGWTDVEDVCRSASRPQDEAEIVKEADEHCHLDDEVRLLLEGQGLYDIRARDDQWLRIWVRPGDLVVVPARRYHRFLVGHADTLHYMQPYASRSDLMQLYRVSGDATRAG